MHPTRILVPPLLSEEESKQFVDQFQEPQEEVTVPVTELVSASPSLSSSKVVSTEEEFNSLVQIDTNSALPLREEEAFVRESDSANDNLLIVEELGITPNFTESQAEPIRSKMESALDVPLPSLSVLYPEMGTPLVDVPAGDTSELEEKEKESKNKKEKKKEKKKSPPEAANIFLSNTVPAKEEKKEKKKNKEKKNKKVGQKQEKEADVSVSDMDTTDIVERTTETASAEIVTTTELSNYVKEVPKVVSFDNQCDQRVSFIESEIMLMESDEDRNKLMLQKQKSFKDANERTMRFLELEALRQEAKTFLHEQCEKAVVLIKRNEAFKFLSARCADAVTEAIIITEQPKISKSPARSISLPNSNLLRHTLLKPRVHDSQGVHTTRRTIVIERRAIPAPAPVPVSTVDDVVEVLLESKPVAPTSTVDLDACSSASIDTNSNEPENNLKNCNSWSDKSAGSIEETYLSISEKAIPNTSSMFPSSISNINGMTQQKERIFFQGNTNSSVYFPPRVLEDPQRLKQALEEHNAKISALNGHSVNYDSGSHSFHSQSSQHSSQHSQRSNHSHQHPIVHGHQYHIHINSGHDSGSYGAHLALEGHLGHFHRFPNNLQQDINRNGTHDRDESVTDSKIVTHNNVDDDNVSYLSDSSAGSQGSYASYDSISRKKRGLGKNRQRKREVVKQVAINADVMDMLNKKIAGGNASVLSKIGGSSPNLSAGTATKLVGTETKGIKKSGNQNKADIMRHLDLFKLGAAEQVPINGNQLIYNKKSSSLPMTRLTEHPMLSCSLNVGLNPHITSSPDQLSPNHENRSTHLNFLDKQGKDTEKLLGKSFMQFKRTGFSNSNSVYRSYWRQKLQSFFSSLDNSFRLEKAIVHLYKVAQVSGLSRPELCCALAEANGNVNEALGRLCDPEFIAEVRLICSVIPVEEMIRTLPRTCLESVGVSVDSEMLASTNIPAAPARSPAAALLALAASFSEDSANIFKSTLSPSSPTNTIISRSVSGYDLDRSSRSTPLNRSTLSSSTSVRSLKSTLLPADEQDLLIYSRSRQNATSPLSPLPHMGLSEKTPYVKRRGNVVQFSPSGSPNSSPPSSQGRGTAPKYIEERFIEVAGPVFESVRGTQSNTHLNSSFHGNLPTSDFDNISVISTSTSKSDSNRGTKKMKSSRLSSSIEEHIAEHMEQEQTMIVMSRRDAYRAVEDSFLVKSPQFQRLKRGQKIINPFKLAPAELSEYRKFQL